MQISQVEVLLISLTAKDQLLIPFPNEKCLDWTKFKAFVDDKFNVPIIIMSVFFYGGKDCGKSRKCWLPAFSTFPKMFLKS